MRRFLVDNQLPEALARWIGQQGVDAEHVLPLGLAQADDAVIWETAARDGYVIITKDEDFALLTVRRSENVSVIWLRLGNGRTPALLTAVANAWPAITQQLDAGARLIEML